MALLDSIDGPADLRTLRPDQLPQLAQEIRDFLITSVTRTGGHLGPNLGVVVTGAARPGVDGGADDGLSCGRSARPA